MKITVRAAQASFDITDEAGNSVASYSVENSTFITDIPGLLKAVSGLAHLFKQLDATHREQPAPVPEPVPAAPSRPITYRDRSPQVQELIEAVRRFKTRTNGISVELSTEQHDGFMALADALTNAGDDASEHNVKMLADRARDYAGMFADDKYVVVRTRLLAAIDAV